jgi:cardiolipin synthase
MNPANVISLIRLLSVPLFVWLILSDETDIAFWLFLAAAISDAVDGIIAKHFDMQTELGAYLDPIADKTLLVTAFIVLGSKGLLPLWIVIPVVSRDALIVGGALVFEKLTGDLNMEPLSISKTNTVFQLLLVLAALLPSVFASPVEPVVTLLSFAVLLTTLVSGATYVYIWTVRAHVFERESDAKAEGNNREP